MCCISIVLYDMSRTLEACDAGTLWGEKPRLSRETCIIGIHSFITGTSNSICITSIIVLSIIVDGL